MSIVDDFVAMPRAEVAALRTELEAERERRMRETMRANRSRELQIVAEDARGFRIPTMIILDELTMISPTEASQALAVARVCELLAAWGRSQEARDAMRDRSTMGARISWLVSKIDAIRGMTDVR